jgi:hypothetical protein
MTDHSLNRALNIKLLKPGFVRALSQAWGYDTCWEECKDRYPAHDPQSNPSFGNCLVSTLAAWADRGFKDFIVPGLAYELDRMSPGWHFRLSAAEGKEIDATWQQFDELAFFVALKPGDRLHTQLVLGSFFDADEEAGLRRRLALLLERMEEKGYRVGVSADDIVDRALRELSYVFMPSQPNLGFQLR